MSSSFIQGALVGSTNLEVLQRLGGIHSATPLSINNSNSSCTSSSVSSIYLAQVFDGALERILDEIASACLVGCVSKRSCNSETKRPALSLSLAKRRLKQNQQQSTSSSELSHRLQELSTTSRFDFYENAENAAGSSSGMGAVLSSVRKHMSTSTREATVTAWESLLQPSTATANSSSSAVVPPQSVMTASFQSSSAAAADVSKPKRVLRLGASRLHTVKGIAEKQEANADDEDAKKLVNGDGGAAAAKAEDYPEKCPPANPLEPKGTFQAEEETTSPNFENTVEIKAEIKMYDEKEVTWCKDANEANIVVDDTAAATLKAEEEQVNKDPVSTEEVEEEGDDTNDAVNGTAKVVHSIITASIQMRSHAKAEEDDDDLLNELLQDDEPVIQHHNQEEQHQHDAEESAAEHDVIDGEQLIPPPQSVVEKTEFTPTDEVVTGAQNTSEVVPLPISPPTPAPRSLFSKRTPIVPSSSAPTFPIIAAAPTTAVSPVSMGCLQVILQPLSFRWRLLLSHLQEAVFRQYSPDSTEYQLLWCLLPRLLETEIQTAMSKGVLPSCLGAVGSGDASVLDSGVASTSTTSSSKLLLSLLLRDIYTFSFTDIPPPTLFLSVLDASSAEGLRLLLLSPPGGGSESDRIRASTLLATTLTIQTTHLSTEELRSVVLRKSLQRLCDSVCLSDLDHYHWYLNATSGGGNNPTLSSGRSGSSAAASLSTPQHPSAAQIAADHLRGIFLFPVTDDIAPGYSSKNRAPISLLEIHERIRRSLSSTITSPMIPSTSSSSSSSHYPPPHPCDISTLDELLDDISRLSTNADAYHGSGTILSRKASVLASSISKPSVRKRLTQYYLGDRWNRHLLEPLRKSLQTGWIANSETVSLFNSSVLLAMVEDYSCGLQESALWTAMTSAVENNSYSGGSSSSAVIDSDVLRSIGMPTGATLETILAVPNPFVFIRGEPVHCGSAVSAIDQGGGVYDASIFPTFNTSSESSTSSIVLGQVDAILKRVGAILTSSSSGGGSSDGCGLLSPIGQLFTKTVLSSLRGSGGGAVIERKGLTVVSSRVGLVSYAGRLRGAPITTTTTTDEMHPDRINTPRVSSSALVGSSSRAAQNSRANKEAAERFNKLAGSWDHRDVVRGGDVASGVASSTPPGKSPVVQRMTRRSAGLVINHQIDGPNSGGKATVRAPLTRRQMMAASAAEEEEQQQQAAAAASGARQRGGKKIEASSEVFAEVKAPKVTKSSTSTSSKQQQISSSNSLTQLMYWWAECSCGSWRLVSEEIKDAVGRGDLVDFTCKMVRKKCNTGDDELPALAGGLKLLNVETKVVDDDGIGENTSTTSALKRGRRKKEDTSVSGPKTTSRKAAKAEEKAQKAADKTIKKANKALIEDESGKSLKNNSRVVSSEKSEQKGANTAAELLKADKREKAEWKRNFKAAAALSKQDDLTATNRPAVQSKPLVDDDSDEDDRMLLNLAPAVLVSSSSSSAAAAAAAAAPVRNNHTAPSVLRQQQHKKAVKSSRRAESSSSDSSSSSGSTSSSSSSSSSSGSSGSSSGSSNAPRRKGAMAPPSLSKPSRPINNSKRSERNMMPPPPQPKKNTAVDSGAGNKRVRGDGSGGISPTVAGMLGGAGGLQHQVTGVNFHNAIKSITDTRRLQLFEEIKRTLDELDQLTQQLSNLKQLPHALHHAIPQQLPPGKSVIEYLKTDVSGNHPAPPRPPSRSAPPVLAEYAAKLTWGSLLKEEARRAQVAQRTLIRKLQWCRTQLGLDKFDTQF